MGMHENLRWRRHPHWPSFDAQIASATFANGWKASLIRGIDANCDDESVEIAAINPEGEIVYNLGTVQVDDQEYTSEDVYSYVQYEHIDLILSLIEKQ